MRVVVVSNARSRSAARHSQVLLRALPASDQITHQVTQTSNELKTLLAGILWQQDDILVIVGGDGSVQWVLTLLSHYVEYDQWPHIAILPAGHTNMSAYDINAQKNFVRCLEQLQQVVTGTKAINAIERQLVEVTSKAETQLGFFFGIGTIVRGIEYFQTQVRPHGGGHETGAALALLRTLWGMLGKQAPFDESLPVTFADTDTAVPLRLCMVTTLTRLMLGLHPYWGQGSGDLRLTFVEQRARYFFRLLPRLFLGKPNKYMRGTNGYCSRNMDTLRLQFCGTFTLDGELYAHDGDLQIKATPNVRFLKL